MMKNICLWAATTVAAVLLAGCQFSNKTNLLLPTAPSSGSSPAGSSSSPTSSGASSSSSSSSASTSSGTVAGGPVAPAAGSWASPTIAGFPNISACTDLQWQISSESLTSVEGTVSALCGGVVNVTANLTGQMSSSDTVNLTAAGQAVGLGITCQFSLTGVGHIESNDAMRLDYQGTTCLGTVSGSEMLRRRTRTSSPSESSESEPVPAPPDQPSAPDDGAFGCTVNTDRDRLIDCIHSHVNPHNEYEAFEVTKRVAWALRGEGAGLLIKTSGENIVPWKGYVFAAGRICYPDGHIFKVISDVGPGGANGPSWQDNGYVDPKLYVPALDPNN